MCVSSLHYFIPAKSNFASNLEMDPLSITAGAIAIGTLLTQVATAFVQLRQVCVHLPGRLHALNNDVADLTGIVDDVEAIALSDPAVVATLNRLREKLLELKSVLLVLVDACSKSKIPLAQARQWSKVQGRLQALQKEIKSHKSHLHIALGASHS